MAAAPSHTPGGAMYPQGISHQPNHPSNLRPYNAMGPPQQFIPQRSMPSVGAPPPSPGRLGAGMPPGGNVLVRGGLQQQGTPPRSMHLSMTGGPSLGGMGSAPGAPRSMSAPGYGAMPRSVQMPSSMMYGNPADEKLDVEFPALGRTQSGGGAAMSGPSSYSVGVMKKDMRNESISATFDMQQDDFPALPGSKPAKSPDQSPMFPSHSPGLHSPSPQGMPGSRGPSSIPQSPASGGIGKMSHIPAKGTSAAVGAIGSGPSSAASSNAISAAAAAAASMPTLSNTAGLGVAPQHRMPLSPQHHLNQQQQLQQHPSLQHNPQQHSQAAQPPHPDVQLSEGDRYGLLGLLRIIRLSDPDYKTLVLGTDLTTLGLNLNTPDVLFPSFASAWADGPVRPKDPPYQVPACYTVRAQLPPITQRVYQFSDETLFYAFYSMPCDMIQQAAANMLYQRDWRYHKEQKIWITRASGTENVQTSPTHERGTFVFFDVNTWKKVTKEFVLEYDQLESNTA